MGWGHSGGSRIFKRKVDRRLSQKIFEILEALELNFRLLLGSNYNKSNTIANCRVKVVIKL